MLTLSIVTIFWSLVESIGVIKVGLSPSKKFVICFIQSSLKMTKNAFYFILKTLFVLMIFKFLSSLFGQIVYKKTDKWYIEWWVTTNDNEWQPMVQRVTMNDNEWQRVVQRVTTNDNEWQRVVQRVTTSGTTSDNEWQWVTTSDNKWYNEWQRVKMSDKEWQRMAMSDSKWEQWYSEWKRHSTLQRMDDCHHFNDKKRYTITLRHG